MASQTKITAFYRPTKQHLDSISIKKSIFNDERQDFVKQERDSTAETEKQSKAIDGNKDALFPQLSKIEQFTVSNLKLNLDVNEELKGKKNSLKTPKVKRKAKTKPSTSCLKLESNPLKITRNKSDNYVKETTSVKDSHEFNPTLIKAETPKQSSENTTSTRKRKMEVISQHSEPIEKTPKKLSDEDLEVNSSSKVRKRLDMGAELVKSCNEQAFGMNNSPAKQVPFLCKGSLSPFKTLLKSPVPKLKEESSLVEKTNTANKPALLEQCPVKSSAVKSLTSLFDKPNSSPNKKLTPEEVKARLGNSKNLSELRAKLATVHKDSDKLKQFYQNQVQLKKFSSIEISVPSSPQKSPAKQSPLKKAISCPKPPAFERFHALAQPPSSTLVLPYKYKVLAEVFRCVDTVVAMLYNRKENIVFSKLKPAVQKMAQRDFTEKHLAQVCHVFPTAYILTQEKQPVSNKSSPLKGGTYQLTITPQLNYLSNELLDEKDPELDANVLGQKNFQPLGPLKLVERRHIFHNRLLKIVKSHHAEFLAEFNPLLSVPEDKITRWHQNFDVDAVPDIPSASLPQAPSTKTFTTAKDVLEQAYHLVKSNPRLEAALRQQAKEKEQCDALNKTNSQDSNLKPPATCINPILKGVSQSLIDKIRAREAAKAEIEMTMKPEEIRRKEMCKTLPKLAQIVRSVFITEKRSVLALSSVIDRVKYSYEGLLSYSAVEEHIELLCSLLPEWISVLKRENVRFIKLDRTVDSNVVYEKLEAAAKS